MISKHNSHVLDKKTRNTNYPYNEIISKPNYSTDNYLFNLIDCTRKFTNEQVSGLKYEGKYFMSDNFKHRPRENEKNRQKKCYHNNFNYMKDNRNYIYTRSKNIFNESEKERPRQNLFNKYPYVYESIEKTNTKNSNNISSENQFITSYIRPDQMPIHKLLKITYDKKYNNINYVPTFLREPSLEAMEAMNHVLNGNMFYVKKQLR
uniref:Homeobox-containing protein n=1 Tax=Strongyloides stercoralis TaxID=6248 RepID=A0A0K0ENH3_STRER